MVPLFPYITCRGALASLAFVKPIDGLAITTLTSKNALGLFLAGGPGAWRCFYRSISGSFVLLLLGVYSTAIGALSDLNLPIIAVIGAGIIVGFLVSSKAISYLIRHFASVTFSVIIGLIFGSIFVIYPGLPSDGTFIVMSALTFSSNTRSQSHEFSQ